MSATAEEMKALAVERAVAEVHDLEDVRAQIVQLFEGARASVAPPPPPAAGPPPPPPPAAPPAPAVVAPSSVWAEIESAADPNDPIAAFAPPPSMDWGPQRAGRFLRRKG